MHSGWKVVRSSARSTAADVHKVVAVGLFPEDGPGLYMTLRMQRRI
jgi:hypothetical protein